MQARSKAVWRTSILAARRSRSDAQRRVENDALTASARVLAASGTTVCAYVPVGSEPGSLTLLDALRDEGNRVLVPLTSTDSALEWAEYTGEDDLVTADFGLREPRGPVLAPETVLQASVVLVPALAVDRRGVRLGRGAGFYDRTLHLADPAARLIAVVRDEELVDELPEDPHDIRMTHALTPGGGLTALAE
ncbi:5-formyltetrahydrofolate cyclo-ligase [Rhodococcus zopfii]|uniref:5-formyltetrahydrofolate cyclo-ligase n=1 Tax=Rhodococcus zopfii TaxID=43772 RepID=A0ABU3WRC3_9NOCA|nr:5-formyltetrahydrofolate cyclo-ligase [Rhodococcus zopfii]MDV2476552.1 5-formyltetrahydrofolate cyclo-ligase [Rhodococcus zopfii]